MMNPNIDLLIENNSIILKPDLTENMCVLNSSDLEYNSEQWKYNRNLNIDKVKEIMNMIKDTKKEILDTVLHCYYFNGKLIVFDGNHRRESLILLSHEQIYIKVCCYIYKDPNLTEKTIDKAITKKFNMINQNTPIPDIYIDILENIDQCDKLKNKKDIIEDIFSEYKMLYPNFYSVNSKCRRPNFNDTIFKDLCNKFDFDSKEQLIEILKECNVKKISSNTKYENMLNKCDKYNFYLFFYF